MTTEAYRPRFWMRGTPANSRQCRKAPLRRQLLSGVQQGARVSGSPL